MAVFSCVSANIMQDTIWLYHGIYPFGRSKQDKSKNLMSVKMSQVRVTRVKTCSLFLGFSNLGTPQAQGIKKAADNNDNHKCTGFICINPDLKILYVEF